MVVSISGRVQRLSRLSFNEIRMVLANPLTLALTRFDWLRCVELIDFFGWNSVGTRHLQNRIPDASIL